MPSGGRSIIEETALAANKTSDTIKADAVSGFSLVYYWTGTLLGTLKLQCRNNERRAFVDVNGATFPTSPNGGAGNDELVINDARHKEYQVVFTFTSGSGDLTIDHWSKSD